LEGDMEGAFGVFDQLPRDTTSLHEYGLWYYYTLMLAEDYKLANEVLQELSDNQDVVVRQVLKDSPIKAQRDFFSHENTVLAAKLKGRVALDLCVMAMLVFGLFSAFADVRTERRRRREAEDDLADISEVARRNDILAGEEIDNLKRQLEDVRMEVTRTYKSRFNVIESLSEEYFLHYGGSQWGDFAENEMLPLFQGIRDEAGEGSKFEAIINSLLNNVMTRLRKEFAGMKEQDFVFLSYVIAGFSTPLIARLMDMQKSEIHTKKHRLVKRIVSSNILGKDELLEYIR